PQEGAVLPPLQVDDVGRLPAGRDLILVDPLEVEAQQIPVAELELESLPRAVPRRAGIGDGLPVHHLAQEHAAVLERDLGQRLRPEEAQPVDEHYAHQPRDHEQAHAQDAGREPDPGVAPPPGRRHRARYFSRRRWRITSARVLTAKVMVNSSAAARNRTRYSVPP